MALSGRIARAVLELTTDGASYSAGIASAKADAKGLGQTWKSVGGDVRVITRQIADFQKEFSGQRLLQSANSMAIAVQRAGGAAAQTAQQKTRLNATMAEAIEKYRALGLQAPKAMVDLERATRMTTQTTSAFGTAVGGMGKSILATAAGFFTAQAAFSAVRTAVRLLTEELKTLTMHGAAVDDVTGSFQRLTSEAGQSGAALLGALNQGTHRTISNFELMKTVNQNLSAGLRLTEAQFGTLATGAFALAQATGGDVKTALETMNDAMLTGRTRALALLTGKINETAAEERYAKSLGVSADELTEAGKLEARRIAILEGVGRATERLGEQTDGLDERVAQARASWANFEDELGRTVATSSVLEAGMTGLGDAIAESMGVKREQLIAAIAKKIDEAAIALVDFAKVGVQVAGFFVKEWHAVNKILGNTAQIADGLRLWSLGWQQSSMLAAGDLKNWKRLDDQIQGLMVTMKLRGEALQDDTRAQAGVDATTKRYLDSLDGLRSKMSAALAGSRAQVAGTEAVTAATGRATVGFGASGEELVKTTKDAETFAKMMRDLSRDLKRGVGTLSDADFLKEFGGKLEDALREMRKWGKTGKDVSAEVLAGFTRLTKIEFGDWIAKENAELRGLAATMRVIADEATRVDDAITAAVGAHIEGTTPARRQGVHLQEDIAFRRAEAEIAAAERSGAAWQNVYAMEARLSKARLDAALAEEQYQFAERTRNIQRTTSVGENEYQALAREHGLLVQQMVEDWQLGEAAKRADLAKTHSAWLKTWAEVKGSFRSLGDQTVGKLGTLLFGLDGVDRSEIKQKAQEAQQEYLKLQRSGKATAEELTLAFRRFHEAEDKANNVAGERWKEVWRSVQRTFTDVLNEMLEFFAKQFIGGMLKRLAASALGQKIAGLFGGGGGAGIAGGGGSGAVMNMAGKVLPGLLGGGAAAAGTTSVIAGTGIPVAAGSAAAAPGGAAAAGGGAGFLANPAFWTNPWTIGAAAAITVGLLVWKKGLFRGGEEGTKVNPRRDKFMNQPAIGGSQKLAARLTELTGEYGGGRLFSAIQKADTVKKYEPAQAAIIARLAAAGQRNVRPFNMGGFIMPGAVVNAVLHGGNRGELVVPLDRVGRDNPQAQRPPQIIHQDNRLIVEGLVSPDNIAKLHRDHLLRLHKEALFFNTDDLATVTARHGSRR